MLNITNWWSIYIYSTSYLKIKKTGVFWKRLTAGLLIACDRFLTSTRAEIMPIFFWDFSFPLHAFSVHSLDAAITRFRAISIFFPFCPLSLKNSDEKFEIILVEILTTINSITFFRFCGYPWTKTWIYFILSTQTFPCSVHKSRFATGFTTSRPKTPIWPYSWKIMS